MHGWQTSTFELFMKSQQVKLSKGTYKIESTRLALNHLLVTLWSKRGIPCQAYKITNRTVLLLLLWAKKRSKVSVYHYFLEYEHGSYRNHVPWYVRHLPLVPFFTYDINLTKLVATVQQVQSVFFSNSLAGICKSFFHQALKVGVNVTPANLRLEQLSCYSIL